MFILTTAVGLKMYLWEDVCVHTESRDGGRIKLNFVEPSKNKIDFYQFNKNYSVPEPESRQTA